MWRSRPTRSISRRYGLLSGKVVTVAHDGITRDRPQERNRATAQGVETSTSEPKGQELIYATRMSLDHTQMKVERRKVNLSPRHGRHGRDQDLLAPHHQLSPLAVHSLKARESQRPPKHNYAV
jgi:hypothetical protein